MHVRIVAEPPAMPGSRRLAKLSIPRASVASVRPRLHGRLDEAIGQYQELVSRDPSHFDGQNVLGIKVGVNAGVLFSDPGSAFSFAVMWSPSR